MEQIFKIETSANAVAWYGAILATLSLLLITYKIYIDKPRLKISVRKNQEIVGQDRNGNLVNIETEKTFWSFSVVNKGRRKIIIEQAGVDYKKSKKSKRHGILTRDYIGPVSKFELNTYDSRSFTVDTGLVPPDSIKNVWVRDTVGKFYKRRF